MREKRLPALLVLEDGTSFTGYSIGASGTTVGEAVFSTAMTGYQETLTDPSYHRQLVIATAPQIGNTGWNSQDNESTQIWAAGFIVRNMSPIASNWRSDITLNDELIRQNIVGISDLDTRALTRHLREAGSLRAAISTAELNPEALLAQVRQSPEMVGAVLTRDVSTKASYVIKPATGPAKYTVAAVDLGIKTATPQQMAERGCAVHVFPADATVADLAAIKPDAVFFSNGPGDPSADTQSVTLLEHVLAARMPFFGICYGHQIFGRTLGFDTYKLKYGHRGINQPVQDLRTAKVEITAHNHGFAVAGEAGQSRDTPYGVAAVSHINLNDGVVEGLELRRDQQPVAFSVQYHPEAAAGPHDASYLFDRFIDLMTAAGKDPEHAKA